MNFSLWFVSFYSTGKRNEWEQLLSLCIRLQALCISSFAVDFVLCTLVMLLLFFIVIHSYFYIGAWASLLLVRSDVRGLAERQSSLEALNSALVGFVQMSPLHFLWGFMQPRFLMAESNIELLFFALVSSVK